MQIARLLATLMSATDADAVGNAVCDLARCDIGLDSVAVTWQLHGRHEVKAVPPWWLADPARFARLYAALREQHAPVADRVNGAAHEDALMLPILGPTGLLGAICCEHRAPITVEQHRRLATLATYASVRLAQLEAAAANKEALGKLTPRQLDVALLAARGRTNAGIAAALGLSENTVKKHLKDIFDVLEVGNRTELALRLTRAESSGRPQP